MRRDATCLAVAATLLLACRPDSSAPRTVTSDPFAVHRRNMVRTQLRGRDITDERVLEAMGRVPRHLFVPKAERHLAYADHPASFTKVAM